MKIGDKVKVIIPGKCVKLFYQQTIKSALFDRAKYPGKHGKWKPWNETDCCNRYFKTKGGINSQTTIGIAFFYYEQEKKT